MKTLKRFLCDCDKLTTRQVNHSSMEVRPCGIDTNVQYCLTTLHPSAPQSNRKSGQCWGSSECSVFTLCRQRAHDSQRAIERLPDPFLLPWCVQVSPQVWARHLLPILHSVALPGLTIFTSCKLMHAIHGVFLKQAENNNNVLGLAILKSSPKNHSAQTTPRPTLSGKSRFRKKGDTIDSTAYKKENRASRLGPLWDAAGCWLTSQRWSLLSSGETKQPFMRWVQLKQTSPCSAV